jgi:hypothetical protein
MRRPVIRRTINPLTLGTLELTMIRRITRQG